MSTGQLMLEFDRIMHLLCQKHIVFYALEVMDVEVHLPKSTEGIKLENYIHNFLH